MCSPVFIFGVTTDPAVGRIACSLFCLMPMTHLWETRAGIQRRKLALASSASFQRELQQNLVIIYINVATEL